VTPLRILITNETLGARSGSDLYVRDLATALLDRGHHPVVFSTVLGVVADELWRHTVPVIDDLAKLSVPPDIIHGQHHLETMMALLHFPGTPAVSVCHGWMPWEEGPPRFPRIRRYVVVDDTCWDRVTALHGIESSSVQLLLNFVDLDRFPPRGRLPATPARAAVFSHEIADDNTLPAIRDACARRGLRLDVIGRASGSVTDTPETRLRDYDVVFAKGRSALEAMAVGSAVILCSHAGLGPLVTEGNVARLRRLNFGVRAIVQIATAGAIEAELAHYASGDAAVVSRWIRADASRDGAIDSWIQIYEKVIHEYRQGGVVDAAAESRAAADYLRDLSVPLKTRVAAVQAHASAIAERDALASRLSQTLTGRDATTRVGTMEHMRRLREQIGFALRRRL
jgi:hypothetical protein